MEFRGILEWKEHWIVDFSHLHPNSVAFLKGWVRGRGLGVERVKVLTVDSPKIESSIPA